MTIAVIVAKTSSTTTRASSAASNGKESANKSSDYWSAGNYYLVISSKKEDGRCASQVPRKEGTCDLELGHKKTFRCFCIYLVPWSWGLTISSAMLSAWTIVLQPVLIWKKTYSKKLGMLNRNQLSGIENLDSSSTNPTIFFTGNTPTNLHVNNCYMAETVDCGYLLKTFTSRWLISLGREESHHWRVNWLVTLHLNIWRHMEILFAW